MPVQQIAENTADIARNTSLIHVLQEWANVIFPILGVIGGVFVWAWKRMQRSIDNMEIALTAHAKSNEALFDDIFTNQRESDKLLNTLSGQHDAIHKKLSSVEICGITGGK